MPSILRKLLVLLPVLLVTTLFFKDHYQSEYKHASIRRLVFFGVTVGLLYSWILIGIIRRRQASFYDVGLQSSYYLYIFMVLTLTGYFILFREISVQHWWENMVARVEHRERVNLKPFQIFKIYRFTNRQVLGNLVMLFPLGIYIPLLYKRLQHFIPVVLIAMLVSVGIEMLQLITSFRSTDIDDVILNTSGAALGFIFLRMMRLLFAAHYNRNLAAA